MMIRPWYRSRLFWLFLPGWAFLLWGWLAFPMNETRVSWTRVERSLWVGDRSRSVCFGWIDAGPKVRFTQGINFLGTRAAATSGPMALEAEELQWFPPAVRREEEFFDPPGVRSSQLSVSYWLLMLGYGALSVSTSYFWQRRKRTIQAGNAGEP